MKTIYFAAGSPGEAAADIERMRLAERRDALRIVVPAAQASALVSRLPSAGGILCRYEPVSAPWLWLRLLGFLGLSARAQIIVLAPQRRFGILKLVALALRGRVGFSDGSGTCVPFSLWKVLRTKVADVVTARGPVCVIGSASPDLLRRILRSVKERYPGAPVCGVLPERPHDLGAEPFDSIVIWEKPRWADWARLLPRCIGRRRFRKIVVPWTAEKFAALKWLGWLLPLGSVEIYNENLDAFSGRNPWRLARHAIWRIRWGWWDRVRIERALRITRSPVGVIGSASGFYLQQILPVVRAQYPQAKIHALLPQSLEEGTGGLFDSVTVLRPRFSSVFAVAWKIAWDRRRFQCWIIPCTNEPYREMKLLAFLLPLRRRHIYNELADGFAVREWRTLWRHLYWRLRDRLPFQVVAGAAGENALARGGHLALYAVRLAAGAPLLGTALLRSFRSNRSRLLPTLAAPAPCVDLVVFGSGIDDWPVTADSLAGRDGVLVRVQRISEDSPSHAVKAALETGDGEFICLLNAGCRLSPPDWLSRLLESFDDRIAQVGPQIASPDGETMLRGFLLESSGALESNSDHAVRWCRRPEFLEVDALPWICVLVRRRALLEAGCFAARSAAGDTIESWADAEFSRRLAANGWRSLCHRGVTAIHPAVNVCCGAVSGKATEEIRP